MFVGIFGIMLGLIGICLALLVFAFWIWMLVDVITNKRLSDTEKILWFVVVFFLHAIGGLIYFLAGRNKS
jgi:hypothetical protein